MAHALILAGPAGVGKLRTALWWASRLKCSQRDVCAGADCRDCKQIAAGSHPDVTLLAPAAEGESLPIESVRTLIRMMALRPVRPGPRIAIVRDAQSLTLQAQSAMLKLLEEPPGFAVLVLVADNAAALLPTIRSRCQLIRFALLEAGEIRRILVEHERDPVFAERAAAESAGRAGRALALTPESIDDREAVITAYEDLRAGKRADIEAVVLELTTRRKEGRPALDALLEWQMQKVQARLATAAPSQEVAARAAQAAAGESPSALLEEASRTAWAMRALERNGNPRLVLRELLLDVRDR